MTSNDIPVPASAADITPEWLTRVWQHLGHDVVVEHVTSRAIGTGQTALSVRFDIDYGKWDGKAPRSVVAKLPHPDPTSRSAGHAQGVYAREYGFYTQIAPTLQVRIPRCFYAALNAANSDFVLLLEDMAPAHQGDQMQGCDVDTARRAVVEIAGLHAPRWGDASLLQHRFLSGVGEGMGDPSSVTPEQFAYFWEAFLARYRERLAPEVIDVGAGLLKHFGNWAHPYAGTRCVTHGDFRLDNVLISDNDPAARICVVDWQTAGLGCGASDVAYFLGAGLLPEARRASERDLLTAYHDALLVAGVKDYTFDQLWRDYIWYSYSGLIMAVVASIVVTQTARGDEMFMVMAHRHGQHALDLGAEKLIAAA